MFYQMPCGVLRIPFLPYPPHQQAMQGRDLLGHAWVVLCATRSTDHASRIMSLGSAMCPARAVAAATSGEAR